MKALQHANWGILLLVSVAIGLNGCVAPAPASTVPPPASATVTPAPPSAPAFVGELCPEDRNAQLAEQTYRLNIGQELNEKDRYIPGQVLVTGNPNEIASVIEAVNGNADYGVTLGQVDNAVNQIALAETQQIAAYQISSEANDPQQAVLATLSALYREALNQGVKLTADPNYLIRAAETALQGDPGSGEASPGSGEASPGSGEASPGSGEASPAMPPSGLITNTTFWGQWAFGDLGIQLVSGVDSEGVPTRTVDAIGKETEIAVFDTSLFPQEGFYRFEGFPSSDPLQYGWIDPVLEVCVSHPVEPTLALPGDTFSAGDHGLFVAALSHAVAPASRIHLIRVLGNNRRGDLFGIIYALAQYKLSRGDQLHNTVINLSLGIVETPVTIEELPGVTQEQWDEICNLNALPCDLSQPLPTSALDTVLSAMYNEGALIVAAAGNRSANQTPKLPAQIPASYPYVLGVAGTNSVRTESCFSNQGNIGEMDVHGPAGDNDNLKNSCDTPQPCTADLCLKSIAAYTFPDQGFAMWNGTSFATPLASGLAALAFEQNGAVDDTSATPNWIHEAIVCAAQAHDEIINVPETLYIISQGSCP